MSLDILKASKNISEKYVRYLKTAFDIADPEYKRLFDQRMNEITAFSKGPYLDVVDSFESGSSVQDLIREGLLHEDFRYLEDIYSKTLYKHQEISARKLALGKNVIVSTGTGSGKTESFLVPILNALMREREEKGQIGPGVRALLIYPMNALANDQISRLRRVLKQYPYITFGSYTGQTEEKYKTALAKYKHLNHGEKPLKNELISREQMKKTPPNILVTNYSMLEYLMLRPKDNSLFQGEYAKYWKFVVLDEAHTYYGSTGIEVSMLLRRLKSYLYSSDIQFILTSATLGGEKSNKEAAMFAQRLCDAPFEPEDVIRAYRIHLIQNDNSITLSTHDYEELNDILESGHSDTKILSMLQTYLGYPLDSVDYSEYLFDVLLRDNTFWKVKLFLSTPKAVKEICGEMGWSEHELSVFVNVASNAVKNRKKLFDARYHMFLRATDGVFVTLGNYKDLSLSRRNMTRVNDTPYRYFEVVTCSQCHAMYLIGMIEDGYLVQKSNISGENVRQAFLLGNTIHNDDEDHLLQDADLSTNEYELCPHCGFIRKANEVHKTSCEHNVSDYISLVEVKNSKSGRVTKCIQCEGVSSLGILRSFFSGQEASTSVIGTALFEELPDQEMLIEEGQNPVGIEDDLGFDDGFDDVPEEKQYVKKAKQFIAFSDNRQAAAFFATYFYETYETFLYSRIVNKNIRQCPEGKPVVNFVKDMSADFRIHQVSDMYDEQPDYMKEAWKAILRELINSYSRNSLVGLGLMSIDFIDDIHFSANGKMKWTAEDVKNICLVLIRSLLEDNAIYAEQAFTEADREFFTNNNVESCYVAANPQNKYTKSFLPKTDSTTNRRFDYMQRLLKASGIESDREMINRMLEAFWNRFLIQQGILTDSVNYEGKQIAANKLKISAGKKWYRCSKCHRLTTYNVAGVCPAYKCTGTLESVDIQELEDQNHYYRIYNDLIIQPLRVVEHTAQLSSEEAYRRQEAFKNQTIDVLSCSTTFEMGVDIGDLETVFMRNMPPSPANYVQRAGRAGRSVKSAALALTFCNKSNHDFSYFNDPVSMINGEIQPPLFKVENEKIGIRHLYSSAFAFFWKKYPELFGKVGVFFGEETTEEGYDLLKEYLESKPEDLKQFLLRTFPDSLVYKFEIESWGWIRWLFDEPDTMYPNLKAVYKQYRDEVDSLYREKWRLEEENLPNSRIIYRIKTYTNENIISFLSRANILPKYGFPVDTVNLQIISEKDSKKLGIDLSRDLSMAISEYAPGCEVVAAGNLIKSRYIKRVPDRGWRLYDYIQCPKCSTMNIEIHHDLQDTSLTHCRQCGLELDTASIRTFLIPEFGFASENKIGKPSLIKPERTFRSAASIANRGNEVHSDSYQIGSLKADVCSMEDGEIAVLNSSKFYVCPNCGYAESEKEAKGFTPFITKKHSNSSGYSCKNERLQRYSLGYRFKTDALQISLNKIFTEDEAFSILQAIVLSACNCLNIENTEIAGCLQFTQRSFGLTYEFIIYDTTPGGAGHVRRFTNEAIMKEVLTGAYWKAKNCDCGGEEGDTSCYKCLRTYQNQHDHDRLKRQYVISGLQGVLDEV